MPYYKELQILQLHCPKTGGTSLENTLQQAQHREFFNYAESKRRHAAQHKEWQQENLYGYEIVDGKEFALQHMTFEQMLRWKYLPANILLDGKGDNDLCIVVVVRHPYSRFVSEYKWRQLFGFRGTFAQFVDTAFANQWHRQSIHMQHFLPQAAFVRGIPLDHPALRVVYFEHMADAMQHLLEELSEQRTQLKGVLLRRDNVTAQVASTKTAQKSWQSYYADDKTLREKVFEMYREDFETFGYEKDF